jgi:hypothetical protein
MNTFKTIDPFPSLVSLSSNIKKLENLISSVIGVRREEEERGGERRREEEERGGGERRREVT